MLRGAALVVLALLLAGCTASVSSIQRPTVQLLDETPWDPARLCVRLTNNDDHRSWSTGRSSFYILDGNRTLHASDLVATYWTDDAFPSYQDIHPRTSLEGCIRFDASGEDPGPYTLVYEYPGGTVNTLLPPRPE